ncbi:M48 family metalloprotease [Pseudooceanicola algae]|uniref:Beta-barrel assembly-enhancing protease n=1 Tax=Pseudooceanicola algae TaxID=1537215 RepID=A0A418SB31_9RHOB|nr:M48 family metalloprotease [Pseudooceanicola algae]QPM91332.1 Beta-barrel assembly-enhancing protease [Pseudooceanicola algae]
MSDASSTRRFGPCTRFIAGGLALLVAACGTTYAVPRVSSQSTEVANAIFAEEQRTGSTSSTSQQPDAADMARFTRVVARVEPVAESVCRRETAGSGRTCDIRVIIDQDMSQPNAYQTYDSSGRPIVAFSRPMLAEVRNDDELAFILGHEMGHHIGAHTDKLQSQAITGALVGGILVATLGGDANDAVLGAYAGTAVGSMAYSQTYELESDVVATYITEQAGYNPVTGARFFARPKPQQTSGGLSFWGSHPPDRKRLATVLETVDQLSANSGELILAR